jgi:hypothetical protein
MGAAIEIEMALDQAVQFEKQLQLLFMQAGKIDVWNKIKARSHAMDVDAAHQARREKEQNIKKQKQLTEALEITVAVVVLIFVLIGVLWGAFELVQYCRHGACSK